MGIIFEVIVWVLIEVVFWGIMFWSGVAIVSVLSFGRWKTQALNNDRKKFRRKPKFIATAVIGFLFWLGIGMLLITGIQHPA